MPTFQQPPPTQVFIGGRQPQAPSEQPPANLRVPDPPFSAGLRDAEDFYAQVINLYPVPTPPYMGGNGLYMGRKLPPSLLIVPDPPFASGFRDAEDRLALFAAQIPLASLPYPKRNLIAGLLPPAITADNPPGGPSFLAIAIQQRSPWPSQFITRGELVFPGEGVTPPTVDDPPFWGVLHIVQTPDDQQFQQRLRYVPQAPVVAANPPFSRNWLWALIASYDQGYRPISITQRRFFPVAPPTAYTLDLQSGVYSITGANADLLVSRIMSLNPGTYGLTGANMDTLVARLAELSPGSYAMTGANASFLATRLLNLDAGNYQINGLNADAIVARLMNLDPGVYLVTGKDAAALANKQLQLDPGVYIITGNNADLSYSAAPPIVLGPTTFFRDSRRR